MADVPPIGKLRHRLLWQTFDPAALDAMNQPSRVPTTVGTFWALVEPLSGMELMNARQLNAETSHAITIRNVGPIKPSDRFLFEATGRRFEVTSVFRVGERNAYLRLHAVERKSPA
jgi:head-tail adaptor